MPGPDAAVVIDLLSRWPSKGLHQVGQGRKTPDIATRLYRAETGSPGSP
jgi:hypothetical protein